MKNQLTYLFLTMLCCVSFAVRGAEVPAGYEYRPMVEEGKTWWCNTYHRLPYVDDIASYDYGITLRGDTVADGVAWKKCMLIDGELRVNPVPLMLLREEDRRIYSYSLYNETESYCCHPEYISEILWPDRNPRQKKIYDFNFEAGDSEKGSMSEPFNMTVHDVLFIENSGSVFRAYDLSGKGEADCVEGVGDVCFDTFPFAPYADRLACAFPKYYSLRWVTNPDGSVLYEGSGGVKLWETDGVEDVATGGWLELRVVGTEVWIAGVAEACVAVADMAGHTVAESVMAAGARLSLADLPAGVYVVTAVAADGSRAVIKMIRR